MLGIIVLCHGSRRKESNELLTNYAEKLKTQYQYEHCITAFMEFAKPDLLSAIEEQIENGIYKIVIVPLFLAPGNHIKQDIPNEIEKVKERYPTIEILFANHLGIDDRIVDVLASRIEEVL